MKSIRAMAFLVFALTVSGCSIKLVSYSPSILMEGTGRVKVGDFRYLPGEKGLLQNNQVDTGAGLNPIHSEVALKYYVSDALSKELKFIGYKLDPSSSIIISGDIHEYSCDYMGFTTVDVKAKIEFVVVNNVDGKATEIYRKMHEGFHSASKWTTTESTLVVNEGLRKCIKSFVEDAQKNKIL